MVRRGADSPRAKTVSLVLHPEPVAFLLDRDTDAAIQ